MTGKKIEPIVHPLASMDEMNEWSQKYIGQDFNSTEMRKLLIRATFQQAFIKPRLTPSVGFLSCKRTTKHGKGNGICQCSDCGTKDLKPELDNVDLQILRLSFTV